MGLSLDGSLQLQDGNVILESGSFVILVDNHPLHLHFCGRHELVGTGYVMLSQLNQQRSQETWLTMGSGEDMSV